MSLLPIHIIAGSIAIVAGFISVFSVKGLKLHRKSGVVFVDALVVLALTGAVIATVRHQPPNIIGGSLAFYMVTTAFLTVRPRNERSRWIDAGVLVVGIAVGAAAIKIGLDALNSPTGAMNGVPSGMMFLFGTVALLAALVTYECCGSGVYRARNESPDTCGECVSRCSSRPVRSSSARQR